MMALAALGPWGSFFMRGACICLALAAAVFVIPAPAVSQAAAPLLGLQAWVDHVVDDMLPFWSTPDALGDPIGAFPGRRCNDGTLSDPAAPCPEGGLSTTDKPSRRPVAQSRQIFAYGAAFHMTGDSQWLDLARAGTDNLFDTFLDPATGAFGRRYDAATDALIAEPRNIQTEVYGLLGPTFLYDLTHDPALHAQIRSVDRSLQADHWLGGGAFSSLPGETVPANRIVGSLDPLNTYLHMLARIAPEPEPEPDRQGYVDQAGEIATYLRGAYWSDARGPFRVRNSDRDGVVDHGHSSKALLFIAQAAALSGDDVLAQWARDKAPAVFDQAFVAASGSWARDTGGDETATCWISAELDQLMAALSLTDAGLRDRLAQTQAFWLQNFVDETYGGIWPMADPVTRLPIAGLAKHQEWKAGFHAFEHALISSLTAGEIADGESVLFFAQAEEFGFDIAYLFDAETADIEVLTAATDVHKVTFAALSFARFAAVPLPAAGALLLLAQDALLPVAPRRAA
jgi:mannose/cellobiose epimerase-like protein (N-acyl-D-glucosamine 2-epimerase family)